MKKGGKFLEKLYSCDGARVKQGNLVLSTELINANVIHSNEGLTLKTSALKLFTVANLHY